MAPSIAQLDAATKPADAVQALKAAVQADVTTEQKPTENVCNAELETRRCINIL